MNRLGCNEGVENYNIQTSPTDLNIIFLNSFNLEKLTPIFKIYYAYHSIIPQKRPNRLLISFKSLSSHHYLCFSIAFLYCEPCKIAAIGPCILPLLLNSAVLLHCLFFLSSNPGSLSFFVLCLKTILVCLSP